jgi:hypothetical protein
MLYNYILLKVFTIKILCFRQFFNKKKVGASTCLWYIFVYFGRLGVIYDSQGPIGVQLGRGALTGSPPCFLLVT